MSEPKPSADVPEPSPAEPVPAPPRKVSLAKRFRRELRVRALLVFRPLLALLPWRLAGALGAGVGRLAYFLVPKERALALAHLQLAFPDWTDARRKQVARQAFGHLGRSALEVIAVRKVQARLADEVLLGPDETALLAAAKASGKGALVVACHVGNWELMARRLAHEGIDCATVAREAQDPRLTRLLEDSRADAGVKTLWRGRPGLAKDMLRLLRDGGFLGLLIDQDTDVQGQFVPFFGRPAFTPRAAGDLAVRTGAWVLFACAHREADGRHRVVLRRVPVPETGDREADALAVTAAATAEIEREIRLRPDEWVWMHRRWKRQPDSPERPAIR
ncbi:MAG: lipid A biosynthesis acyltransferase [Deltaproteobacteria bacterium]|nr:lipid A biosynthesis acyltransferase [Deltaproteobacteria bacterium]